MGWLHSNLLILTAAADFFLGDIHVQPPPWNVKDSTQREKAKRKEGAWRIDALTSMCRKFPKFPILRYQPHTAPMFLANCAAITSITYYVKLYFIAICANSPACKNQTPFWGFYALSKFMKRVSGPRQVRVRFMSNCAPHSNVITHITPTSHPHVEIYLQGWQSV